MPSFDNTDNSLYHQYSHELQELFAEVLPLRFDPSAWEEREAVEKRIGDKIIEAMLDWNLGRSDVHALGRLLNLCKGQECPPDPDPEIQYLPPTPIPVGRKT